MKVLKWIKWFYTFLLIGCVPFQTRENFDIHQVDRNSRSENQHRSVDPEVRLKLLENQLRGREELLQYGKALPYFRDLSERIEFLEVQGYSARQKWLDERKFWFRVQEKKRQFAQVVGQKEIAIGMTAEQVKEAWGQPHEINVSGAPQLGNMIWVYRTRVSTDNGFQDEKRYVIFENGQVIGWDTQSW